LKNIQLLKLRKKEQKLLDKKKKFIIRN